MRVELGKGENHIVLVVGPSYGVELGHVMIYRYEGLRRVAEDDFSIAFARDYWAVLITRGYHVIPESPQMAALKRSNAATNILLNDFEALKNDKMWDGAAGS